MGIAAKKNISKETHQLREELNCSQERMAHIIGVSVRTISRWEKGKNKPSKLAWRTMREVDSILKKMDGVIEKGKEKEWLKTPNEALNDKTPLEVMEQGPSGILKVERLLGRIEWGIPT